MNWIEFMKYDHRQCVPVLLYTRYRQLLMYDTIIMKREKNDVKNALMSN